MCIRDRKSTARITKITLETTIVENALSVYGQVGKAVALDLSLIHISEPTRP